MKTICTDSQYNEIAKIHKDMLTNSGFLSYCNHEFISFFYKKINEDKINHIQIELDNYSNIVGFVFFTEDKNRYMKNFLVNNLLEILKYPKAYLPILKAVFRSLLNSKNNFDVPDYKNEIVQIAVAKGQQGKGIGKKIILKLEQFLSAKNTKEYYLQVHKKNERALILYKNSGFMEVGELTEVENEKILMKKVLGN